MPVQTLSSILGLAFASGVNLYASVLVVGLGIRLGWLSGLPGDLHVLASPVILTAAGVMYFLEFFADKIPYVSIAWDSVHTIIRPLGAAALALASAAHLSPEYQALAMLAGGSVALGSHSTKMGYRLLAHASPEPVSDFIFSLAEDLGVGGLVLLTYKHPLAALVLVTAMLGGIALALPVLWRVLSFVFDGIMGRFAALTPRRKAAEPPAWVAAHMAGLGATGQYQAIPCYARRVPKTPRMKRGYLVLWKKEAYFAWIGIFGKRLTALGPWDFPAGCPVRGGLLFDLAGPAQWSVYFTKEHSTLFFSQPATLATSTPN